MQKQTLQRQDNVMEPIDIIVLLIIALVVGGATYYIIRAKLRGQKCIGCPDAKTCSGNCSSCHACSYREENKEK